MWPVTVIPPGAGRLYFKTSTQDHRVHIQNPRRKKKANSDLTTEAVPGTETTEIKSSDFAGSFALPSPDLRFRNREKVCKEGRKN